MKKMCLAVLAFVLTMVGAATLASKISPIRAYATAASEHESASGNGSRG